MSGQSALPGCEQSRSSVITHHAHPSRMAESLRARALKTAGAAGAFAGRAGAQARRPRRGPGRSRSACSTSSSARGWLSERRVVEQMVHARRSRYGARRIERDLLRERRIRRKRSRRRCRSSRTASSRRRARCGAGSSAAACRAARRSARARRAFCRAAASILEVDPEGDQRRRAMIGRWRKADGGQAAGHASQSRRRCSWPRAVRAATTFGLHAGEGHHGGAGRVSKARKSSSRARSPKRSTAAARRPRPTRCRTATR